MTKTGHLHLRSCHPRTARGNQKANDRNRQILAGLSVDGLKIHLLYVIKGTRLDDLYQAGNYACMTQDEYVDAVCEFLAHTPKDVVIQRLTGDPHPEELVAPDWSVRKTETLTLIRQTLEHRNWRQECSYDINGRFFWIRIDISAYIKYT